MGDFGDKFRKAREKKELSFDDVSNVTKISSRMLQAIEEEHFDQLPGGVFNKGFIRAYAKHLGLDSEEAVTDYLECLRQAQVNAHEVWDPQPQIQQRPAAPAKSPKAAHAVEPTKSANKTQPAAEAEELPELQLPRAEHVARGRKDLSLNSSREIPWGMVAVAAVVFVIGTNDANTSAYAGSVDEVAFYNSALTSTQILNHFNAASSPTAGTYQDLVRSDGAALQLSNNVPEPSSMLLLGVGGAALLRRRRAAVR